MDPKTKNLVYRYYAYSFFSGLHFISAVLVPFFTEWGKITMTWALFLQSWFTFCIFVMEVPTGVVADVLGRKKSILAGCLILSVATLVYGSTPKLWVFFLGEFLFATGLAFISGADKALLATLLGKETEDDQKRCVYANVHTLHMVSIAVGAPIGSLIAALWGLNYPMLLTFVPTTIAGLIVLTIPEPENGYKSPDKDLWRTFKRGYELLKADRVGVSWAFNSSIVAVGAYFVIWLYQPTMMKMGIPVAYFGLAHTAIALSEALVSKLYPKLVLLCGNSRRYYQITAALCALSFVLLAVSLVFPLAMQWLALVLFIVIGGGFGLTRLEFMMFEMTEFIDPEHQATILSMINMARRLGQAAANPIVGKFSEVSLMLSLSFVGALTLASFFFPAKEREVS